MTTLFRHLEEADGVGRRNRRTAAWLLAWIAVLIAISIAIIWLRNA